MWVSANLAVTPDQQLAGHHVWEDRAAAMWAAGNPEEFLETKSILGHKSEEVYIREPSPVTPRGPHVLPEISR